jgi:tRNA threonylcarbamoyladenosine biosynthesis protein TsaB
LWAAAWKTTSGRVRAKAASIRGRSLTSATTVSIALAPAGEEFGLPGAEMTWRAGRNQTTTLLGQIDGLLHICDIESSDLSGVIVAIGPGSFNALRVGLATAKGLCLAHDLPIFGVGTLDAAAAAFEGWGRPLRAFVDAGRRRVVAGDYRPGLTGLTLAAALEHRTHDELTEGLTEPTLLVGDLPETAARQLAGDPNAILLPASTRRRRASILIDMAHPRWLKGDADDLTTLEPLYVHTRLRQPAAREPAS